MRKNLPIATHQLRSSVGTYAYAVERMSVVTSEGRVNRNTVVYVHG